MFRITPYTILFLVATLSQIFFFDNLSASVLVAPLVYIVFIALLPIEFNQLTMLLLGALTGFVMDAAMGTEGLNSIATIFVSFIRIHLIRAIVGRERSERGVPSELSFGEGIFFRYIAAFVALHHVVFFLFESLSMVNLLYTSMRFAISSVISILFVWLISRLFSLNNILK